MAKREMSKFRVDCDEPGMQIAGAGHLLKGDSIIKPNTILTLPSGALDEHGGVRACMTPMNASAEAEFEKKKKKVEKEWRECLPKGQNPDGQPLEFLEGRTLTKEEIETFVRKMVAKVGPSRRVFQRTLKKKRPNFNPGSMGVAQEQAAKPVDDLEEDDAPVPQQAQGARASDA